MLPIHDSDHGILILVEWKHFIKHDSIFILNVQISVLEEHKTNVHGVASVKTMIMYVQFFDYPYRPI